MTEYLIESENSTDHWPYFSSIGHNVLDLGCGRWFTEDVNELSPIYFRDSGASKVIGVDSNETDIQFYKKVTEDDYFGFEFLQMNINNAEQVRELITKYNITALKCDIEGAEVALLDLTEKDMENIVEFGLEFHSYELEEALLKKIEEWGFTIKVKASFKNTPDFMGVLFCSK